MKTIVYSAIYGDYDDVKVQPVEVKIENYFRRKWGAAPRQQIYKTPFNK